MNVKRYSIAGGVSLAIHAAFLFVAQEPKAYAMPAGAQSSSVSLNFKAIPAPATPVETPKPVTQQKVPPAPAKVEPTPQKVVKKSQKKAKVAKKTKPKVKKVIKKKPPAKKPIVKEKQVVQNSEPKSRPKVAPTKTEVEKPQPEPQLATTNNGASSKPVMVKKPSFLTRPSAPQYPRLARKRGVEGVALYEVWLDDNGNQVKQVLISSSGATLLDKSALTAIKKWKFSPHTVNGQKMAHRVQIPVRFKLDR